MHFSGVAGANNKNRHNFSIIKATDWKLGPHTYFVVRNIFGKFHDVMIPISPIFLNFQKIGFLPDFLAIFSWLFGELLENRLICDKQIPYLAKNENTSYNKQYSGCKPILNDTRYRVIV